MAYKMINLDDETKQQPQEQTQPQSQQQEAQGQQGQQQATTPQQSQSSGSGAAGGSKGGTGTAGSPAGNQAYQNAMAALQQAQSQLPTYQSSYGSQILDIYNQIVGRKPFSYNVNEDALYEQLRDQYVQTGRTAMMDTMGQAQAMTGGYGNSYAQSVGQQAYQGYLQQLSDVVPELYDRALSRYTQEGQDLYNLMGLSGDMDEREYGRYQDAVSRYWQNLDYVEGQADKEYDRLMEMSQLMGYVPSLEEWMATGMSEEQAKAYQKYFAGLMGAEGAGDGHTGIPGLDYGAKYGWVNDNPEWLETADGKNWLKTASGQNYLATHEPNDTGTSTYGSGLPGFGNLVSAIQEAVNSGNIAKAESLMETAAATGRMTEEEQRTIVAILNGNR